MQTFKNDLNRKYNTKKPKQKKEAEHIDQAISLPQHYAPRVEPPETPVCYNNDLYKIAIEQIFSVFLKHLAPETAKDKVHVSGGCLMKDYDINMLSLNHKRSFGDIDWKISLCSREVTSSIFTFFKEYKKQDGNITPELKQTFCNYPLIRALFELIEMGEEFICIYSNLKTTIINDIPVERRQTVIQMRWYGGVAVEYVMFEESIDEHILGTDASTTAGYYNPLMTNVRFPADDYYEKDNSGNIVRSDRSAKDFENREINLLFPKKYKSLLDCDPTRIFHLIWTESSSKFSLSAQLKSDLKSYLSSRRGRVFENLSPRRLYNNLKLMFFSGLAVKNLKTIIEINLFEELFPHISKLTPKLQKLIMHLVHRVAYESDKDNFLSSSLLFYAIYWLDIKDRDYSPYHILDLSNHAIQIPERPVSELNISESLYRDELNEEIHRVNIFQLSTWEKDFLLKPTIEGVFDLALEEIFEKTVDTIHHEKIEEENKFLVAQMLNIAIDEAVDNVFEITKAMVSSQAPHVMDNFFDMLVHEAIKKVDDYWYIQARTDYDQGLYVDAFKAFKKAVELNPNHILAIQKCFEIKLKLNDQGAAIKYCTLLINIPRVIYQDRYGYSLHMYNDYIYKLYCHRADLYLRTDKYEESESDFQMAISLNQLLPDAFYGLGNISKKISEKYNHTIEEIEIKIKESPSNSKLQKLKKEYKINIQQQEDKKSEAQLWYQRALDRNAEFRQASVAMKDLNNFYNGKSVKPRSKQKNIPLFIPFYNPNPSSIPRAISEVTIMLNNRSKQLVTEAENSEQAGDYQNAINIYKRIVSFNAGYSILARHRSIKMYIKLSSFDNNLKHTYLNKAQEYADQLINMSEEDYYIHYLDSDTPQIAPYDSFEYQHIESLYYKMKIFYKLKDYGASANVMSNIIKTYDKSQSDPNYLVLELIMDSYIILGDIQRILVKNTNDTKKLSSKKQLQSTALDHYEKALDIAHQIVARVEYKLPTIYLGLGKLALSNSDFQTTQSFYLQALELLNSDIISLSPRDEYQTLFDCAEYISGAFINQATEVSLMMSDSVVHESDIYFLTISERIYKHAIDCLPGELHYAHIQLIKIKLIFSGNYVHFLTSLPSNTENYYSSYIFINNKYLVYINADGEYEPVTISDVDLFKRQMRESNTCNLTNTYFPIEKIKEYITANGGHLPENKYDIVKLIINKLLNKHENSPLYLQKDLRLLLAFCHYLKDEYDASIRNYEMAMPSNRHNKPKNKLKGSHLLHSSISHEDLIISDALINLINISINKIREIKKTTKASIIQQDISKGLKSKEKKTTKTSPSSLTKNDEFELLNATYQGIHIRLVNLIRDGNADQDTITESVLLSLEHIINISSKKETEQFNSLTAHAYLDRANVFAAQADYSSSQSSPRKQIISLQNSAFYAYKQTINFAEKCNQEDELLQELLAKASVGIGNIFFTKAVFIFDEDGSHDKVQGTKLLNNAEKFYLEACSYSKSSSEACFRLGEIQFVRESNDLESNPIIVKKAASKPNVSDQSIFSGSSKDEKLEPAKQLPDSSKGFQKCETYSIT
ncbi:MAG: hypothetical protein P1U74_08620 [Legionellaceae bacterium]|nr:hypothetical protein [Legionellaceae bacterium]